jgi:hypothetical protein
MISGPYQILCRWSNQKELDGRKFKKLGEGERAYRVWMAKLEGRRPLGRLRRRWGNNTNMNPEDVGCWGWTNSISVSTGTDGGLF